MRLMQETTTQSHDHLILSWGDYFVEALTCSGSEHFQTQLSDKGFIHRTHFFHNPKNDPKSILSQLGLINFPKLQRVIVCARFFERFLTFSLGGSVGQLISTEEKRLHPLLQSFRLNNQAEESGPALGSSSLCDAFEFKPSLQAETLAQAMTSLKERGAKRIVLQTSQDCLSAEQFQSANSIAADMALEIFPRSYKCLSRKNYSENLKDACLWGRFLEFKDEILSFFSDAGLNVELFFLTPQGPIDHKICTPTQTMQGLESILHKHGTRNNLHHFLELGFENFNFYNFLSDYSKHPVSEENRAGQKMFLQPTQSFSINSHKEIEVSTQCFGFDPGPIFLGRGQRALFIDQLLFSIQEKSEDISQKSFLHEIFYNKDLEQKNRKFKIQNHSLQKNCSLMQINSQNFDQFLLNKIKDHLILDLTLRGGIHNPVHVIGPLSQIMRTCLNLDSLNKKTSPTLEFSSLNFSEIIAAEIFQ